MALTADPPRAAPATARHGAGGTGRPPAPPGDAERDSYGDRGLALVTLSSLISFGALLLSQAKFLAVSGPLLLLVPLIAFTFAYYLISLAVNLGTQGFDLPAHHDLVRRFTPPRWPSLDVFLPVCGEETATLRNTWTHAARLARRYPGPARVHVLDDAYSFGSLNEEMAGDFGFAYVVRPNRGWMKKAGNLRHAFGRTDGDFILILDADFAPRDDMPAHMLPYFYADPVLGVSPVPAVLPCPAPDDPGRSGVPGRCRSCSTGSSRFPGTGTAGRSAWAPVPSTGARPWGRSAAPP